MNIKRFWVIFIMANILNVKSNKKKAAYPISVPISPATVPSTAPSSAPSSVPIPDSVPIAPSSVPIPGSVPIPDSVPIAPGSAPPAAVPPGSVDLLACEESDDIEGLFSDLLSSVQIFKQELVTIQNKLKNVEKICKKERKKYEKLAAKQNKGNKAPSGFAMPTEISDELCKFMSVDNGTKVARTEVTQFIIKYIEQFDLQNKSNRQLIIPNQPLCALWKINDTEEVTYFNIQKFMNQHFIKKL